MELFQYIEIERIFPEFSRNFGSKELELGFDIVESDKSPVGELLSEDLADVSDKKSLASSAELKDGIVSKLSETR